MAIKKKAAKPAKHAARPSGGSASKKAAKKAAPKKASKPAKAAQKKAVAKPVAKKAAAKPAAKPISKQAPAIKQVKPAAHPHSKPVPPPVKANTKEHVAAKPASSGFKPAHNPPPKPQAKKEPAKPVKVVIPEIKTKSAVKYQPDFTKSVLDTPQSQIQTGPTMRYSDAELVEFKEIILKKLEAAKKELTYLQGLITRKDEMG